MPGSRRRRPQSIEASARHDLAALPPMYQFSALAGCYLALARRMDAGVPTRDMGQLAREMRQCLMALYQMAPVKEADDPADELARKREERMAGETAAADG
jgi:hypothetical protein